MERKMKLLLSLIICLSFFSTIAPASASCISLQTNLYRPSYGQDIISLQVFLKEKGYIDFAPNGYFGPKTFFAVQALQKANGIKPSGIVGSRTRALIQKSSCNSTPDSSSSMGGVNTSQMTSLLTSTKDTSITSQQTVLAGNLFTTVSKEATGSFASLPITCVISNNGSTCDIEIAWTTAGVSLPKVSQRAVPFSYDASSSKIVRPISYGSTMFTLQDGGTLLSARTVYASCEVDYFWNGTICKQNDPTLNTPTPLVSTSPSPSVVQPPSVISQAPVPAIVQKSYTPPQNDIVSQYGPRWKDGICSQTTPTGKGVTYYLSPFGDNTNSGLTKNAPAKDLTKIRPIIKAGDVIHLLAGTYSLSTSLSLNGQSGSELSPIVVEGECDKTIVTTNFDSASQQKPAVYIGNGSFITVKNMIIENKTGFGFLAEYVNNLTLQDIEVRNAYLNGIWVHRANNVLVSHVHIHDTVLENANRAREAVYGDTLWHQGIGFGRTSNATVEYARVENNWGEGIDFIGLNGNNPDTGVGTSAETNNVARYNYVRNSFSVGLYFDQMRNSVFDSNFVIFDDPRFNRNGVPPLGIAIADEGGGVPRSNGNLVIKNNIVVGASTGILYGAYGMGYGVHEASIVHNTVVDSLTGIRISAPKQGISHSGTVVKNNIFSWKASTTYPAVIVPETNGVTFSHNAWVGNEKGTETITSTKDIKSKNSLFPSACTSPLNLLCYQPESTSSVKSAGEYTSLVNFDFVKKTRSSLPTIGAFEALP